MFLFKEKWLICFVGKDESKQVKNDIARISKRIGISEPRVDFCVIDCPGLKSIKTLESADNEIEEELREKLFNLVVNKKSKHRARKVAVVLPRVSFHDNGVYALAVRLFPHEIKDNFYVACYMSDFLDTCQRKECFPKMCRECEELNGCAHSCRLSLLWEIFDKNDKVLDLVDFE